MGELLEVVAAEGNILVVGVGRIVVAGRQPLQRWRKNQGALDPTWQELMLYELEGLFAKRVVPELRLEGNGGCEGSQGRKLPDTLCLELPVAKGWHQAHRLDEVEH